MYPGQHVGILPDGSAKAPGSTGTGAHGRFKVIILSDVVRIMSTYEFKSNRLSEVAYSAT